MTTNNKQKDKPMKSIDALLFIDPLSPHSWAFEPTVKRILLRYGVYLNFRNVIFTNLWKLNSSKWHPVSNPFAHWIEVARSGGMTCILPDAEASQIQTPLLPLVSIKAAQLQGKSRAIVFMRRLQERFFLEGVDVSKQEIIFDCARRASLDMDEFLRDIHHEETLKMLYDDFELAKKLDIEKNATFVFFDYFTGKEGIRIPGAHPYDVYETIIQEILDGQVQPQSLPPLEQFIAHYKFVASAEIE
ncbi:MAG: DsbA family protein, partial [Bacilli bacterium]